MHVHSMVQACRVRWCLCALFIAASMMFLQQMNFISWWNSKWLLVIQKSISTRNVSSIPRETLPSEVDLLAWIHDFKQQLSEAVADTKIKTSCESLKARRKSFSPCDNTTCLHKFSESAEERVLQMRVPHMRVSPEQLDNISRIGKDVEPKKYIFLTAASSNHYNESQALVYNLHHNVFSKMHPSNFSFVYVDLGLTSLQRRRVEKNCDCIVVSMPFESFPTLSKSLFCYQWKPLIIKALLPKADVLFYVDASVRFRNNTNLETVANTVRKKGVQFTRDVMAIPNHTLWPMFRFYGEMPCQFSSYAELRAGIMFLHNRPFIDKVILDPWVSCSLNSTCMCPVDPMQVFNCPHRTFEVGECHRFDQSSISIIFVKLYGKKIGYLHLNGNVLDVRKGHSMDFFRD